MGHRNAILAHDVPEHREVLGTAGRYYRRGDKEDLAAELQRLLDDPVAIDRFRGAAEQRVRERYSWDAVAADYERYFREVLA
jgi:glycosyltransferase involved in cell wall biosynthesis